jgi:hypothetical protein
VPSPARIVSSPPHPPHSVCRMNALHPFNLSVGCLFFPHQHNRARCSHPMEPRTCLTTEHPTPGKPARRMCRPGVLRRVLSSLCAYVPPTQDRPQQLADSSAMFLQQTGLRLPALVRDPTRFGSATVDLTFNIDAESAHASARNPRVGSCAVQGSVRP